MKVLYYQAYGAHSNDLTSRFKESVNATGAEMVRVGSINVAEVALANENYDLVIIHHENDKPIFNLKTRFPLTRFAVYSGIIPSLLAQDQTYKNEVREEFLKIYDFVLEDLAGDVIRLLNELNTKNCDNSARSVENTKVGLAKLINSNQGFGRIVDGLNIIPGYLIYGKEVNKDGRISFKCYDPLIEREDAAFLIWNYEGSHEIDLDRIKEIDLEKREIIYNNS